jgi:hypothetical protein
MLWAQFSLKPELNLPRMGDELFKQQVEYKDPGRSGEHVLWDFSRLQAVNPEYKVFYRTPKFFGHDIQLLGLNTLSAGETELENMIVGSEHFTSYYYQVKDGQLVLLGHANAVSQMYHKQPLLVIPFPFGYGQKIESSYHSQTFYAGAKPMQSIGDIHIEADAQGMMILPDKDTLYHVMRIKTMRTLVELPDTALHNKAPAQNLSEPLNIRIENYLWYARGYRYPVFETIRHFNANDTVQPSFFSTAFFYPPQDHYYLDTDPENRQLVEAQKKEKKNAPLSDFMFNAFPNPVATQLNVEIFLPVEAGIKIQLRSIAGNSVYLNENKGKFTRGNHRFQFHVSSLPTGYYLLSIWADNYMHSETILKH